MLASNRAALHGCTTSLSKAGANATIAASAYRVTCRTVIMPLPRLTM
jgi:hypothetical protein